MSKKVSEIFSEVHSDQNQMEGSSQLPSSTLASSNQLPRVVTGALQNNGVGISDITFEPKNKRNLRILPSSLSNTASIRRRARTLKRVSSQAAAARADPHLVDNTDDGRRDGDDPEVHMLAESRRAYKQECPPFVFPMNRKAGLAGERRVVLLASDEGRCPDGSECQRTEIVCHVYTPKLGFWTLDLDGARMIVKGRGVGHGAAYMIWWGSEEGFGEKAVAFSSGAPRGEGRTPSHDETKQSDRKAFHEGSDGETGRPSHPRSHHSRNAKNKGRDTIKQLPAAITATERERKAKRESERLRTLQKQKGQATPRPFLKNNNNATANNPTLPTPSARTSPTLSTDDSLLVPTPLKRERSPSQNPPRHPHPRPRPRSPSPSITEISHSTTPSIDRYMQTNTTLHISLSTNDHGTIPIQLRRCMTMETFFASVLSAWDQDGDEGSVAAVAATFDWLGDQGPMVVRRKVEDSFEVMLRTIAEAPVWGLGVGVGDGLGKRRCDVRVRIIMRG